MDLDDPWYDRPTLNNASNKIKRKAYILGNISYPWDDTPTYINE